MGGGSEELRGPDFTHGVAIEAVKESEPLLGHAHGEAVVLVRRGDALHAIGASCTHYGGALAEGIVVGSTIRCPLHHARFCLETGDALAAPALNPVACFDVEKRDGKAFVTKKREPGLVAVRTKGDPASVVIVGAGAAGHAAAEMLRREGYGGTITMIGSDSAPPVDRPNLSKDYLAGTAPEEWIPLRPPEHYEALKIDMRLGTEVTAIDPKAKTLSLAGGTSITYDALLLATGATPIRLSIPGADGKNVHLLRSLGDSRAIIAAAEGTKTAVVIGASFIGLEVAASLRTRGLEVHVVAPDARPLEKIMGSALGDFVRALHEEKGVKFHLGERPKSIDANGVTLESGARVEGSLVVMGVGVKPNTELAEKAGIKVDRGIQVDEFLQTSAPGIYAAGDIARVPDAASGERIRVEHWVVAQRQGQVAARNILGKREKYAFAPFFWSQHYDVPIAYVGHAEKWDRVDIEGSLDKRDVTVVLRGTGERALAVITISRDTESLRAEAAMEAGDTKTLASLAR